MLSVQKSVNHEIWWQSNPSLTTSLQRQKSVSLCERALTDLLTLAYQKIINLSFCEKFENYSGLFYC